MRSSATIGNLWPLCKSCHHVAQAHPENGEHICGEMTNTQCPTCHNRGMMPCQCREYIGPTRDEFALMIHATNEEIVRYRLIGK